MMIMVRWIFGGMIFWFSLTRISILFWKFGDRFRTVLGIFEVFLMMIMVWRITGGMIFWFSLINNITVYKRRPLEAHQQSQARFGLVMITEVDNKLIANG